MNLKKVRSRERVSWSTAGNLSTTCAKRRQPALLNKRTVWTRKMEREKTKRPCSFVLFLFSFFFAKYGHSSKSFIRARTWLVPLFIGSGTSKAFYSTYNIHIHTYMLIKTQPTIINQQILKGSPPNNPHMLFGGLIIKRNGLLSLFYCCCIPCPSTTSACTFSGQESQTTYDIFTRTRTKRRQRHSGAAAN